MQLTIEQMKLINNIILVISHIGSSRLEKTPFSFEGCLKTLSQAILIESITSLEVNLVFHLITFFLDNSTELVINKGGNEENIQNLRQFQEELSQIIPN